MVKTGFAFRSTILALVAIAALVAAPAAGAKDKKLDPDKVTPLIFVHGGSARAPSSSRSRCA